MMERPSHHAIKQKSPLIVEIVGLAGAGKTTLERALSRRDGNNLVVADLGLRKRKHIPIFVSHVPYLLPLFLRRRRSSRWFTWDEMKALVYLKAWPRVVRQQASNDGPLVLLEHGPVFKLATLNAFGPEKLQSQGFEPWWHSMFEQWALTLDIVIWLYAPDKILVERINARHKRHAVKGKSEREAYEYLMRYQKSYEQILAKLTAYGKPALLAFDTSQASIEQIVDEVLVTCQSSPSPLANEALDQYYPKF
jgi:shikimate kinase